MPTGLELEMLAFLNRYNEIFATFDGDRIADFYVIPSITMRGDGSIHCFQSREEILQFFQGVANTYKGEGTQSATANDVEAVPIGERSALIAHPDVGVAKSMRDLSALAQVQEARKTASMGSARIARDMNDQAVVAAYARVAGPGWLVFVELPIGEWTKD